MLCSCRTSCESEKYFENLQQLGEDLKSNNNFIEFPDFASALASKERLIILSVLKEKDRCVCELEAILNKSQSTISHHLRKLESVGLILGFKKGNYTYYNLVKENLDKYREMIKNIL